MNNKKRAIVMAIALFCLQIAAFSQTLSMKLSNTTVKKAMTEFKQKTGLSFVFESSDVDTKKIVNVDAKTYQEAVSQILRGQDVTYEIKEKNVIVTKKSVQPSNANTGQQKNKVSGVISDVNGEPLIGATVIEKGTSNGTITNAEGRFTLDVISDGQLEVSYVGYQKITVKANGRSNLVINLKSDSELLEDVVVIGYGTMKKSDLTSSISTVNSEVIGQAATTSISDVLQGKVPGLDIQAERYEGENRSMLIRGTRSLNASNEPLVIIDGIPGNMSDINVHDIESVEVMKDASSAAIYGSQGANGVIIITTKHGKAGKTKISYDGYYGVMKPEFADMASGPKFVQMKRDAYLMANNMWTKGNKGTVDDNLLFTPDEMTVIQSGNYYDWYDLVYRNGSILSNSLSVTGGNDRTQAKVSLGYDYQKGYVKTNQTKSFYFNAAIDHRINKWASIGSVLRFKNRDNSGFATYGQALFYGTPVTRPYDDEGNVIPIPNTNEGAYNILLNYQDGQYINDTKSNKTSLLGYIDLKFTKDLTMHTNIGVNLNNTRTGYFYGADSFTSHGKNLSGRSSSYDYHFTANNTLSYSHLFDKHKITMDFVQEVQKYEWDTMSGSGENEDVEMLSYYNLATNLENKNIGSGYSGWSMASFMGRLRYDYNGKYLFNASIRSDGSSRLAEGHKWGTFISAGAAWRISSEDFMKQADWLSNLKLRLSYGEVGNQAISVYQTIASLNSYPVLFGEDGLYAYRPDRLVNKDLGWERTKTVNLGLDFGFLDNRISGSVDIYKSTTCDLLMQRSLPTTIGFSNIFDNIGSTENQGIELSVNADIIQTRDFTLSAYGTFSYNKNKIVKLATDEDDITNGWFIGKPISVVYDYRKIGIWQIGEEEQAAKYNCKPGDIKIEDIAGTSEGITGDDRTFLGQYDPKYIASFGLRVAYKGFDFAINTSGRFGHLINSGYYGYNLITSGNRWCADVDYWTPDNPTNEWPRAANDIANRGLCALLKGDYIKIQDMTLGYDFSGLLKAANLPITRARVYCQMRNIGYLYKAAGHNINPESTSTEITVPQCINFGINLNF